jgi:hypothetical protein
MPRRIRQSASAHDRTVPHCEAIHVVKERRKANGSLSAVPQHLNVVSVPVPVQNQKINHQHLVNKMNALRIIYFLPLNTLL